MAQKTLEKIRGRYDDRENKPSPEILKLLEDRKKARGEKDWQTSDRLRDTILARGWQVSDTADGQRIESTQD